MPVNPLLIMLALCAFVIVIAGSSWLKKRKGR
jgi:hypothetical protein